MLQDDPYLPTDTTRVSETDSGPGFSLPAATTITMPD